MPANHASSDCECWAVSWLPAPLGVRMTIGQPTSPPNIVRILAAWLTTWSMATSRKLIVMISTIGRSPPIAAPTAAPTKPSSEIGVSRIRSGPNSPIRPAVTL